MEDEWLRTFTLRPDMNLEMGAFVVMPNHFHAILIIGNNDFNSDDIFVSPATNKFGPQSKNLASIVRGFKAAITKKAENINFGFAWQPSYHEHIIRNPASYETISNYIINNPGQWHQDRFYR